MFWKHFRNPSKRSALRQDLKLASPRAAHILGTNSNVIRSLPNVVERITGPEQFLDSTYADLKIRDCVTIIAELDCSAKGLQRENPDDFKCMPDSPSKLRVRRFAANLISLNYETSKDSSQMDDFTWPAFRESSLRISSRCLVHRADCVFKIPILFVPRACLRTAISRQTSKK